ncbi:MAG: 4-(cytidine 5'-diphospho)-2-C-methyl-D-erythritol kinase, partial [Kangiellaceae bacterium]|nr:4-(cytidine 5'-diphospho)-2-C-methyl-D-erythritol kinase [Kangiellaceae bacterium]
WQCGLDIDQLADIGLTLGADVPVFVRQHSAWAEGIGEKLTAIELPKIWYLVVYPDCFVSTAKIFSHKALTRNCEISTIRTFFAEGGPKHGVNVMQPVVYDLYPQVKEAAKWLEAYNNSTRMTGSGSCLFAPFDNEQEARKIASRCKWPCFVAEGKNHVVLRIQTPLINND